ncbi:MAG: AlkA N-terminal domain-containing protein [Gemmatimonadales bacterium]
MLDPELTPEVCRRAVEARDARFDGLFFVGITSTRIYCRPVCPAKVSYPDRRRFFGTAAAAEHAGFRPCLRCRPELAPGRSRVDAVSRLAQVAAHRVAGGALNGRNVAALARELGVSERHLRRAFERELGVSPLELAQTHRLLLAKQLLADTRLPVTRVAFASGFQSLRRFNTVFREQYRMAPSKLRRREAQAAAPADDLVVLTLGYREPFNWAALRSTLAGRTLPGIDEVTDTGYRRTIAVGAARGAIQADDAGDGQLRVALTPGLVPVLMPVLARLRQLFDLDAVPSVIEARLAEGGLRDAIRANPGLRLAGSVDGFETALQVILAESAGRVVEALGEPVATPWPSLNRVAPFAGRIFEVGARRLEALGVPRLRAGMLVAVARLIVGEELRLEQGSEVSETWRVLVERADVPEEWATEIVQRALGWPDAFHDAGSGSAVAEAWRPWRAYAALYLGKIRDPSLRSG